LWGDGLTLIAISEVYGLEINVITSEPGPAFVVEVIPQQQTINKVIMLAHMGDLYFESLWHIVEEPELKDLNPDFSIDPKDLILGEQIGKGSGGEVYLAFWNGYRVCAKVCGFSINLILLRRKSQEVYFLTRSEMPFCGKLIY
jgi:hypothetical protein